jgi:hypothetical protein
MAVISGYTSLLANISTWLARSDITADAPTLVQLWEERFYRQPKNFGHWMATGSLSVSFSSTATVPTDFLSARSFYLNGQDNRPLIVSSVEQLLVAYPRSGSSGIPRWIARDGANFIFGPRPSGTFTLNGTYYAKPTLLRNFAADAAAHYLIVNAPDLILYGSLLEAEAYTKNDARIAVWSAAHQQAMADYRDLIKAQNFSGGSMQTLVA